MNEKFFRGARVLSESIEPPANALVQAPEVFRLVPERVFGFAATLANALGQLNHLVNGLFAIQPHDVVEQELAPRLLGFTGRAREHFHEHGQHHLRPALANEGKGAVKIQKDMADSRARGETRAEFHGSNKWGSGLHCCPNLSRSGRRKQLWESETGRPRQGERTSSCADQLEQLLGVFG